MAVVVCGERQERETGDNDCLYIDKADGRYNISWGRQVCLGR